jgi:hypothetical protein
LLRPGIESCSRASSSLVLIERLGGGVSLDVTGRRNYLIHIRLGQSDTEKLRKQTFLYRDSASNKLRQHAEQQGCTPFHIVTSHDQETRILILKLIRGHGLVFRKLRLMTCHKRKPLRPPELSGTPEAVCTQRPAGRLKLTLSTLQASISSSRHRHLFFRFPIAYSKGRQWLNARSIDL